MQAYECSWLSLVYLHRAFLQRMCLDHISYLEILDSPQVSDPVLDDDSVEEQLQPPSQQQQQQQQQEQQVGSMLSGGNEQSISLLQLFF